MQLCSSFVRDLKDSNNDDSDDGKDSDDKGLELSSDSELSLGDEPLMEIQVSFDSYNPGQNSWDASPIAHQNGSSSLFPPLP